MVCPIPDIREEFEKWMTIIDNLKRQIFPGEEPGLVSGFSRLLRNSTTVDLPKDLKDLITQMLMKDPSERPRASGVQNAVVEEIVKGEKII